MFWRNSETIDQREKNRYRCHHRSFVEILQSFVRWSDGCHRGKNSFLYRWVKRSRGIESFRKFSLRFHRRNEVSTKLNDITDLIQAKEKNRRFVHISCLLLQIAATPKKVELSRSIDRLNFSFNVTNIFRWKMEFDRNNFVYRKHIVYSKFWEISSFQVKKSFSFPFRIDQSVFFSISRCFG